MKLLISTFVVLFAQISLANISNQELAAICFQKGVQKIMSQAEGHGCLIDPKKIEVASVDNRPGNPVKFIFYQSKEICTSTGSKIQKLVQFYHGECL